VTDSTVEATNRAQLAARLEELRESPAYRNYELVRERVLDMKERARQTSGVEHPSAYWQEELEHIDFMIDAPPIMIDSLRRHCFYITGTRPYEYREVTGKPERRLGFEAKLRALSGLGRPDLRVPESPLLGGFGYEIDGELFNVDTLKFYEVMIALDRSGVLELFKRPEGGTLCEIGSGWGGFAYQFKTLFPRTTLVLVDFPELFLFSATYLLTAFPDAQAVFWSEEDGESAFAGPERPDFVFVPHTEIGSLVPPRLDLTVNMVSFQEMTTEQVRGYVQWAKARGSQHLYSLNRDRSPYNGELTNVRDVIREAYDLTELDLLPVSYTKLVDPWIARVKGKAKPKKGSANRKSGNDHLDYRHVLGRLRSG
jgi:hypothetical protein